MRASSITSQSEILDGHDRSTYQRIADANQRRSAHDTRFAATAIRLLHRLAREHLAEVYGTAYYTDVTPLAGCYAAICQQPQQGTATIGGRPTTAPAIKPHA
jgi:hypothetical protein